MIPFRLIPLDTSVAEGLRARRADAEGNALQPQVADEPNAFPCRHCLRDAEPGEPMLLASYSPFQTQNTYREIGPVFVHADRCARHADERAIPDQLRRRLLALRGYDRNQILLAGEVVPGAEVEGAIERLLSRADVAWIHVRFAKPGCFACRIERADAA